MVYDFIKPIVQLFYPTYYNIEVKGLEKIPSDQPVVLACNHTNAFVDPILLAVQLKQKVRFYARGDVFKGKALLWFLNQINMSPIYRAVDGFSNAKLKNDKVFAECRTRLNNNETLLIYPEGICIQEKRLVPLKKGLARILFHAGDDTVLKKDVLIIPIGLNYTNAKKFRSKVLINIGDPFLLDEYKKKVADEGTSLVSSFTKMLEIKMCALIVNIEHKENDEAVEAINEIFLDQIVAERKLDKKSLAKHFSVRREIAQIINFQTNKNAEKMQGLKKKVLSYMDDIKAYKLRDHLIRPETIENTKSFDFILEFLIIWIGTPIYGLGLALNYLPYYLAKKLASKKGVSREFRASVYLHIAMFAWLAFYAVQLVVFGLIFRSWTALGAYAFVVPLLGVYNLKYYPTMKKIFGRWKLLRMARKDRKSVEGLMHDRAQILEELNLARKEYLAVNT